MPVFSLLGIGEYPDGEGDSSLEVKNWAYTKTGNLMKHWKARMGLLMTFPVWTKARNSYGFKSTVQ